MSSSSSSLAFFFSTTFFGAGGFQFSGLSYFEVLTSLKPSSILSSFYLTSMPFKNLDIIASPYLPFNIPTQCKAASLTPLSLSSTAFIKGGKISSDILYNTSI